MRKGDLVLNGVRSPCKDCPDRFVGCHNVCEEYRKFKEKANEVRNKRNMIRIIYNDKW